MKVPKEYYGVYIVHVGPMVYDMYTEPDEAIKHVRKLIEGDIPAEFEVGVTDFARKCFIRGQGNQPKLTMAEARRELDRLGLWLEAWRKGRR